MANLIQSIERLTADPVAQACARLMACSEPWVTLGRTYETSLAIVQDPTRETYVLREGSAVVGFLIICMTGAFIFISSMWKVSRTSSGTALKVWATFTAP